MTGTPTVTLELDDIQSGALHERPSPYAGTYLLLRIDDRAAGRELVRRLQHVVDSGRPSSDPARDAWITAAFTYHGLKALGVPQSSLDSFAPEFREGMAARAALLGDVGDSSPEHWEEPLGSSDVHVALAALSPDAERLQPVVEKARRAHAELAGVEVIWRQDCYQLESGRTSFGFKDGIGQPTIEGSGRPASNPGERPLKPGEIILGYPDETGELPPMPVPEVLGRNGTYVVFRKLHTRVAAYRQYLRAKAATREDEARLGAKMVGRWQSGAPLEIAPERDDPELGADPARNTDFGYADDPRGFKCPAGAHLHRQFEFVKTQWLNDGIFIGAPAEKDPLVGQGDGTGTFTIPQTPIRRRLPEVPPFVVTRGGEYCFAPGLRALRWLADLDIAPPAEKRTT